MGYLTQWNPTDLAQCVGVTTEQIMEWIEQKKLIATLDESFAGPSVYHLPLTETVAAVALRDGKDPGEARAKLMKGRLKPFVHTPDRKTPQELHDSAERFRIRNRLPVPDRKKTWGDGDPRKERE